MVHYFGFFSWSPDSLVKLIQNSIGPSDTVEPLVLTISSRIFGLLDRESDAINRTANSITFPEIEGEIENLLRYKAWGAKIQSFLIPSSNIFFEKYGDGIYLKVQGIVFRATANLEVGMASNCLLFCLPLPTLDGTIKVSSTNVILDVKLLWDGSKFVPYVTMESNIKIKFGKGLKILNLVDALFDIKTMLMDKIREIIDKNVVTKLDEIVTSSGNNELQRLEYKLSNAGYAVLFNSPIDWTVRNNVLRIAVKTGNANNITSTDIVPPNDKMLCLSADIVRIFLPLFSSHFSTTRERRQADNRLIFTCVEPKLQCETTACTICTDFNISRASDGILYDKYHNCIPQFDFMEWLENNFGRFLGSVIDEDEILSWIGKKADDFISSIFSK
ncbi:unnamed protein product [Cylicocyclus nassatus]|uniref:Lipid-binding serum glycoprotein N-terminal domain-containing protein n=1 Tax=Cylicocyclus nassatus TaxID=53992 RepID=A0AA36DRD8_CYLNA|nr:unnamed protein product [Cylicocyclus nassatus]